MAEDRRPGSEDTAKEEEIEGSTSLFTRTPPVDVYLTREEVQRRRRRALGERVEEPPRILRLRSPA